MILLWPAFLFLLGLMPLMAAAYVWMLRRRRRFAVRYSSLSLIREALTQQSRWRRHLPFALFLFALSSLIVAMGRPTAIVSVPAGQVTIILALDVSRSMCSTDIQPNRLEAAKTAARLFVERQSSNTQIGIVAFAGFAELVQAPTADQELLQDAIESLATARRTAIGSAIIKSLDTIAEVDANIAPVTGASSKPEPTPAPQGAYAPHIIVLLTDGVSNQGPLPVEAAQQAADRGVRVCPIGFGTASGQSGPLPFCGTRSQSGDPFGGGGFFGGGGGGGFRRGIDDATLKQVADMTGGEYYTAESAGELQRVFENLPTHLITRHELMEISVAFAAFGALFAGLAVGLSLLWHPLP
ncbi:MAG: VWA domain-containing protein [Chloroflexi bacterium]|nr:VWA domain-containing protein [Chloroflexota bacterium]